MFIVYLFVRLRNAPLPAAVIEIRSCLQINF